MNGALNIFERAYQVSPVKGSNGWVSRSAAASYLLGWHGIAEPQGQNPARIRLRMSSNSFGGGRHA